MATQAPIRKASEFSAGEVADSIQESAETSVMDLMVILAKRQRTVWRVTLGFAATATLVSLLIPARYTATVTLLPPQQNSSLAGQLSAQLGAVGGMMALAGGGGGASSFLKNPNDMYVGLLMSRTVEDAVIQHFDLMKEYHAKYLVDARKKLERHVTIEGNTKDGLLHISVSDASPSRAAEIANGYLDQFRRQSENLAISEASQRRLFFERQLHEASETLAKAEESLKDTQQKTGVLQLDSQARALIESATSIRAQIMAKEVQLQSMKTYASADNAQLIQAQHELASLRSQLAQLTGSGDLSDSVIVPKGQITEASLEYVRKLRDVKYNETIFEILARQFEVAKLDEAKEGAPIQVVDVAVPPDKRSWPQRSLIVIAATLLGFIFGLILVLLRHSFDEMKRDAEARSKWESLSRDMRFWAREKA